MSDNNQENKTEALNEDAKGKELSPEDLEQVIGGNEFDLDLKQGEFIKIVGPSGAGKSTLIGILPRVN